MLASTNANANNANGASPSEPVGSQTIPILTPTSMSVPVPTSSTVSTSSAESTTITSSNVQSNTNNNTNNNSNSSHSAVTSTVVKYIDRRHDHHASQWHHRHHDRPRSATYGTGHEYDDDNGNNNGTLSFRISDMASTIDDQQRMERTLRDITIVGHSASHHGGHGHGHAHHQYTSSAPIIMTPGTSVSSSTGGNGNSNSNNVATRTLQPSRAESLARQPQPRVPNIDPNRTPRSSANFGEVGNGSSNVVSPRRRLVPTSTSMTMTHAHDDDHDDTIHMRHELKELASYIANNNNKDKDGDHTIPDFTYDASPFAGVSLVSRCSNASCGSAIWRCVMFVARRQSRLPWSCGGRFTRVLISKYMATLLLALTLISLFIYDISRAVGDSDTDFYAQWVIVGIGCIFLCHTIMCSYYIDLYCISILFWADLICVASLIPDVYSLWDNQWSWCGMIRNASHPLSLSSSSLFDMRLWRYYQLFRLCRGVKLWTVWRLCYPWRAAKHPSDDTRVSRLSTRHTRVAASVEGSQTWWVLLLGTLLLFSLPLLDQRISNQQSPSVTLTMLHSIPDEVLSSSLLLSASDNDAQLLYIRIRTTSVPDVIPSLSSYRDDDLWYMCSDVSSCSSNNSSQAIYSIAQWHINTAYAHIVFIALLLILFVATSIGLRSSMKAITIPLARAVVSSRQAAKLLFGLDANDNASTRPLDEMLLLESLTARILDMLRVDATLTRDTKFSTPTSDWLIRVTQTPYAGACIDNNRIKAECKRIADTGVGSSIKTIAQIPELSSLAKCLGNPLSAKFFYEFMKSIYAFENVACYNELQEYRTDRERLYQRADTMWQQFISPDAENQVNLRHEVVMDIEDQLKTEYNANIFASAEAEIWLLMSKDSFRRFLESDYCLVLRHTFTFGELPYDQLRRVTVSVPPSPSTPSTPSSTSNQRRSFNIAATTNTHVTHGNNGNGSGSVSSPTTPSSSAPPSPKRTSHILIPSIPSSSSMTNNITNVSTPLISSTMSVLVAPTPTLTAAATV